MIVHLGNIKLGDKGEYIGRGSPLGNPFHSGIDGTRDEVIDMYKDWLIEEIDKDNQQVLDELNRLLGLSKSPDGVVLLCWCYPKKCHGGVIKEILEIMNECEVPEQETR